MRKQIGRMAELIRIIAAGSLACLALASCLASQARAQEIEPGEFIALPAGTNLAIFYYVYGHNTSYNLAGGPTFDNSSLEQNFGVGRYVHYFDLGGHPAVIQLIQPFGSLSGANVGGRRVGSAFGAANLSISGSYWFYSNSATKTHFNTTVFLYPPTGTYDRTSSINVGSNRWEGDIQFGLSKGLTDRISMDFAFDANFFGDNTKSFPGNRRQSQEPIYRGQIWATYEWSRAFFTSLGWEGLFGGREQINGNFDGVKGERQRIRAAGTLFLSPTLQTILEVNHDVERTGGFKQDFGLTLRVLKAF